MINLACFNNLVLLPLSNGCVGKSTEMLARAKDNYVLLGAHPGHAGCMKC